MGLAVIMLGGVASHLALTAESQVCEECVKSVIY